MKLNEDNQGFVNFNLQDFKTKNGYTLVYIIVFDTATLFDQEYILSNLILNIPGNKVCDDINGDAYIDISNESEGYINGNKSINLVSSICIGWLDKILFNESKNWKASFNDLTNEGKKLYYSIRKLHNNKEVRIVTFLN